MKQSEVHSLVMVINSYLVRRLNSYEGLSGKVQIILKKNTGETIYKGTSHQCGMELEY